ncbi:MAG: RluA family pseudouridine synthase [Actinomycetota bacterium]|nr:RluA family pseudouridine synthase [Actinomycetota bacterium]
MTSISLVTTEQDAGARADVVLARAAGVPRTLAQRALREGHVTVAGNVIRPSYRLEVGDRIEGELPQAALGTPQPEDIPIAIRYEDERLLVVSKPAGIVTHPARGNEQGTLVNALLALGKPLAGMTSSRPGIVHRLDKDTSGLLLVAKDDAAHAHLVGALQARAITRTYLALVRGTPSSDRGSIDAPLGRHPRRRVAMAVVPGGRSAVTHFTVLSHAERVSLLEVTLETGRTHQIRVHLAHLGHPVVGDRVYGGGGDLPRALGLTRPFLHAWKLAFPHPDDNRRIPVTDPLPEDLRSALAVTGIPEPGG